MIKKITDNEKDQVKTAIQLLDPDSNGCSTSEIYSLIHPDLQTTYNKIATRQYSKMMCVLRALEQSREVVVDRVPVGLRKVKRIIKLSGKQLPRPTIVPAPAQTEAPSSRLSYVRPPIESTAPTERERHSRQFECQICPNNFISTPAADKPYRKTCQECGSLYLIDGNRAYRLDPIPIEVWKKVSTL